MLYELEGQRRSNIGLRWCSHGRIHLTKILRGESWSTRERDFLSNPAVRTTWRVGQKGICFKKYFGVSPLRTHFKPGIGPSSRRALVNGHDQNADDARTTNQDWRSEFQGLIAQPLVGMSFRLASAVDRASTKLFLRAFDAAENDDAKIL